MNSITSEEKSTNLIYSQKLNLIYFITSILSLLFVFFSIIELDAILNPQNIIILKIIFDIIALFSTINILLFLPFYPLFFIIFRTKDLNFLEKLSLTIGTNLVFYILIGYMGFFLGIPLNSLYFFIVLLSVFLLLTSYIIYSEFKKSKYIFLKGIRNTNPKGEPILSLIKTKLTFNGILMIIFLTLLCVLNIIRFSYFFGTDPWLHIVIIKKITYLESLPVEDFHTTMGLHVYCVVIYYFSGIDFLLIPRFFVLYSVFVSALIFYNILLRVFKNKNLAILGVLVFESSSLGTRYTMIQFWPSGLSYILCLYVFYLFYIRLQQFNKVEPPNKKELVKEMPFFYILITLFFVAAALSHVLTILVLLIALIWIYFIYFIKNTSRGIDFLLVCGLGGIFLIFSFFGIGEGHYFYLDDVVFPWYYYIFGAIGASIIILPIALRLKKSILYTTGRYGSTLRGETSIIFKKIDEKIIIPLVSIFGVGFLIFFTIANAVFFHLNISNIFSGFEIAVISALSVWGLILFQKKPRGKVLFIWLLYFVGILGAMALYEIISAKNTPILFRLYILMNPLVVLGFIAYIYKLVKSHSIKLSKTKFFAIFIISFSIWSASFYEFLTIDDFNLHKREASTIQWYSEHTDEPESVYAKFGYPFVFMYYDYPYDEKEDAPGIYETQDFISYKKDLFPPDNHFDKDGNNVLKELKNETENDVYILLDDYYIKKEGLEAYGHLSDKEMEEYYQMDYMNRICSSKSISGEESALYWVI